MHLPPSSSVRTTWSNPTRGGLQVWAESCSPHTHLGFSNTPYTLHRRYVHLYKIKQDRCLRLYRRIFHVSFCPFRDDTQKPRLRVVAVCGLLEKCEAKRPTCCYWKSTIQDSGCCEPRWMPCRPRTWTYWITPLTLTKLSVCLSVCQPVTTKPWLNRLLVSLSDKMTSVMSRFHHLFFFF